MKGVTKWSGRTSCNRLIHCEMEDMDEDRMWHWLDVEITSATGLSAQGKFVKDWGKKPE